MGPKDEPKEEAHIVLAAVAQKGTAQGGGAIITGRL